jgi:hypothetical protein
MVQGTFGGAVATGGYKSQGVGCTVKVAGDCEAVVALVMQVSAHVPRTI